MTNILLLIAILAQSSTSEIPYKNILTKTYSKKWLQHFYDRASSSNSYCNLCCLNITRGGVLKDCGYHTLCIYKKNIPGTHCKGLMAVQLNEADKYTILDAHNTLRNKVASGKEYAGFPGPQASAANMRRLDWDDELELIAERWAAQCTLSRDRCRDTERFPVGQNIAAAQAIQGNYLEIIYKWYSKVKYFNNDYSGRYPATKSSEKTDEYTQLIWAETYKVGCARVVYQEYNNLNFEVVYKELFVCNYGPTGNIPGQPVYVSGAPCSACYPGTKCETEFNSLCGKMCSNGVCQRNFTTPVASTVNYEVSDPRINYNKQIRTCSIPSFSSLYFTAVYTCIILFLM